MQWGSDDPAVPGCQVPLLGFVAYKYVSLLLLVAQTVSVIFALRISRTTYAADVPYLNSTAVVVCEVLKFVGSFLLVWRENDYSLFQALKISVHQIIFRPLDTIRVGIPALLYTLQNNLIFIALSNLSGAMYQVTYQLKILSTALLSVIILQSTLSADKWTSLILLTVGVTLIQLPTGGKTDTVQGNYLVGMIAVLCACMTSGLAGVYFEKILKGSRTSIWVRNMQLGSLGTMLGLMGAYWNDGTQIRTHGFFQGYNTSAWVAILLQSAGGLIVAAVLKFADNILKCFGNALAIVLSCLASYYLLGEYTPTWLFGIGVIAVCFATFAYGTDFPIIHYTTHPKEAVQASFYALLNRKSRDLPVTSTV